MCLCVCSVLLLVVLIKTEPAGLVAVALKFHQQRDIVRFSSGLKKVEDLIQMF